MAKVLDGDFCAMQREGSPRYDYFCNDWKDGRRRWIEGLWKLYPLSDISEEPSKSDLASNKGLREDFERRQNERSAGNADGRSQQPTYQVEDSLLGPSFSMGSEETLVPGRVRSAAYAPSERWGDSQETLF